MNLNKFVKFGRCVFRQGASSVERHVVVCQRYRYQNSRFEKQSKQRRNGFNKNVLGSVGLAAGFFSFNKKKDKNNDKNDTIEDDKKKDINENLNDNKNDDNNLNESKENMEHVAQFGSVRVEEHPSWQAGRRVISSLPSYSRSQVSKHNTEESTWITYNHGVYDVTPFLPLHPGTASMLYLAVNGNHDVGSFWTQLGFHNQEEVHKMLEEYRIGNIDRTDFIETAIKPPDIDEELLNDRKHLLTYAFSLEPFIAETPIEALRKHFYTPVKYHFVRNHNPVPTLLDWNDTFSIHGIGVENRDEEEGITLKYSDLFEMPSVENDVYIQCGGHRRSDFNKYGPTNGSKWAVGACSNSHYKGVSLRDVLKYGGINVDDLDKLMQDVMNSSDKTKEYHIHFIGADTDSKGQGYGISIPLSKALDPHGGVMIAYEQNGEALTRDHGFPARLIVPGWVGARSVKWIEEIIIADHPSKLRTFTKAYILNADGVEMRGLPVNSAIHFPSANETFDKDTSMIHIEGEAHAGDGNGIIRVDVSIDGGKTWTNATLVRPNQPFKQEFAWTKWRCNVPLTKEMKKAKNEEMKKENNDSPYLEFEVVCRAFDSNHNRQPESCQNDLTFNGKGYAANEYHRVPIQIERKRVY